VSTPVSGHNRIGRYILLGALVFALVIVGGGFAGYVYIESRKDNEAYERALAGGSKAHLNAYLAEYPGGRHVGQAHRAIDELDWQATSKNVPGYLAYLKLHPQGAYAAQAREKADDLTWDHLNRRGNIAALEEYLDVFPEGKSASLARGQIEKKLACNRSYAQQELAKLQAQGGLVDAASEGAENRYSRKQGTAYSTTHFSGKTATTYHHDGSYTSQDGVEIRYRVTNGSRFLVYERIEGEVSFRTKAGVFWRGLLGGWIGAGVGSARDSQNGMQDGAVAGARKGYEMASHKDKVVITQRLGPGETYSGSAYLRAKYKVLNSDFKAERIQAAISEPLLKRNTAPGC